MTDIKGYKLYVNLGASQVRRRLKGVGFGVRKVETAGRGQAVIIYTATGEHHRKLCALFDGLIAPSYEDEKPEDQ
jgi:DNA transformation protein